MGKYSKVDTAETYDRRPWFEAGKYDVEVISVQDKATVNKGDCFIAEFLILAVYILNIRCTTIGEAMTLYTEQAAGFKAAGLPIPPQPLMPGTEASWVAPLNKTPTMGNIKGFMIAALGLDYRNLGPYETRMGALTERATQPDNPLEGAKLHLDAVAITTKTGHPFTRHDWSALADGSGIDPASLLGPRVGPPPPPPPSSAATYHPVGTSPGKGATHQLVNGAWLPL